MFKRSLRTIVSLCLLGIMLATSLPGDWLHDHDHKSSAHGMQTELGEITGECGLCEFHLLLYRDVVVLRPDPVRPVFMIPDDRIVTVYHTRVVGSPVDRGPPALS